MNRTLLAIPVLALAACGYTDAGSGTNTLLVTARARFTVGDDSTDVRVQVHKAGLAVDNASTIGVRDGETGDIFPLARDSSGSYRASIPGYHRRLALEVQAPNSSGGKPDALAAKLEGPSPHVIVNPKAGGITRGSQGSTLDVEWACNDGIGADEVTIGVDTGFSKVVTSDSGKAAGPAMATLLSGSYELTVTRTNTTDLAGGVTGSAFSISFGVETRFDIY